MSQTLQLCNLPNDILFIVFDYLLPKDFEKLFIISKRFNINFNNTFAYICLTNLGFKIEQSNSFVIYTILNSGKFKILLEKRYSDKERLSLII
jgi:hypothetical protein